MNPTETYTGLPPGYSPDLSKALPSAPVPPLPPLVPFHARVTMDTNARLPSTWRTGIGKKLTNRRIIELQREGFYGSGLKLPPLDAAKTCIQCKSTVNTRKLPFDYLPQPGQVYCKKCRLVHRERRDKEVEKSKRLKELVEQRREEEYV